jgi:hypothetical protein
LYTEFLYLQTQNCSSTIHKSFIQILCERNRLSAQKNSSCLFNGSVAPEWATNGQCFSG